MGGRFSCFDANRLSTVYEHANKSITESEVTEFVATSTLFQPVQPRKKHSKRSRPKLTTLESCQERTRASQKCSPGWIQPQSPFRSMEKAQGSTRIFSSNANSTSVNLINKVYSRQSSPEPVMKLYRSVSPLVKGPEIL